MSQGEDPELLSMRASLVDAVRSGLFTGREVMERLGMTAGEWGGWCRAEQVRRSKAAGRSGGTSAPRLARVSLVGPRARAPAAVVALRGGLRVRVAPGFDEAELVRLVRALSSC